MVPTLQEFVDARRRHYKPMEDAIRAALVLAQALEAAFALTPPEFHHRIHVVYQGDDTRGRPACSLTVQHPPLS